jgi:putative ATPase
MKNAEKTSEPGGRGSDIDVRRPLAERMRPKTLDEVVGQEKLVGPDGVLRKIVERGEPVSLIFWGPPGTGKTTLARIIAHEMEADFIEISAVSAKKADVEKVITRARENWNLKIRTILFVDEIHRFNKAQQDAFLPHVESGLITFIGATTENPSFEVISPLISRSRVIVVEQLSEDEIKEIVRRAVRLMAGNSSDARALGSASHIDSAPAKSPAINRFISPAALDMLAHLAHGDARTALGTLEVAKDLAGKKTITPEIVEAAAGRKMPRYDKTGDGHYDTISAFIKSLRAGDESAALYYMARMIAAGEDPKFIARRMVVFASEDVGLAGNFALTLAISAFDAVERIGLPECGINLAHVVVALCRSKKSRESVNEWYEAQRLAKEFPDAPIPLAIRNAPTKLMKNLGYNKGYKWEAGFKTGESYLPDEVAKAMRK